MARRTTTVAVAFELHLRQRRGLAASSVRKVTDAVTAFTAERPDWRRMSTGELERWLDARRWRGRELGARARYWWLSTLTGFYRWAVADGRCRANPAAAAIRPRLPALHARPIDAGELAVVMALTPAGPVRVAMSLMLYGGLRCCEVAGLRWRDVDEAHATIRVRGKGGKVRWVRLSPALAVELPERGAGLEPVTGATWSAATTSRRVREHLRASCHVDATAHQLRHTAATWAHAACGDVVKVQAFLGHASVATTMIYVRVPTVEVAAMVDDFGAALVAALVAA